MIIKMEVEGGNKVIAAHQNQGESVVIDDATRPSWMFIDDLHDIEISDISHDFIPADNQFDHFYLNVLREVGPNPRVLIKARRTNGDDIGIACERAMYLLNDNGKTIERLN